MKLDALRLDASAINGLATLKRRTGIETRNVLCRWAFCVSLSEATVPRADVAASKREVDISWDILTGDLSAVLLGLLKARCVKDGIEPNRDNLNDQLTRHVHRGIGYLLSNQKVQSIDGLLDLAA